MFIKNLLGRCRDLFQHPNQPRTTAAEVADGDDEEAHASYYNTHPPGYGDRSLGGAPCFLLFCFCCSQLQVQLYRCLVCWYKTKPQALFPLERHSFAFDK